MAKYYNCAIVPVKVRAPKDKSNSEDTVGVIFTWIIAALRDEAFADEKDTHAEPNSYSLTWGSDYYLR